MTPEPFPLQWPQAYPVTDRRQESKFKCTLAEARDGVMRELAMLAASEIVISSNVQVDKRGLIPGSGRLVYDNPGVAIYFKYRNKESIIACDHWKYLHENMRAVQNSLAAIRGLERWGCTDIISQALSQRKQLPAPAAPATQPRSCWDLLEIAAYSRVDQIKEAYKKLSKKYHPDNQVTGSKEKFIQLTRAFEEAIKIAGQ